MKEVTRPNELHVEFNCKVRPKIITLCGSTRFTHAYQLQQLQLTLLGYIVLTVGVNTKADEFLQLDRRVQSEDKKRLDALHLRKIEMSDAIMVLNVEGYIGDSTKEEIRYAYQNGVEIRFLENYVTMHAMLKMPTDDWLAQFIFEAEAADEG